MRSTFLWYHLFIGILDTNLCPVGLCTDAFGSTEQNERTLNVDYVSAEWSAQNIIKSQKLRWSKDQEKSKQFWGLS